MPFLCIRNGPLWLVFTVFTVFTLLTTFSLEKQHAIVLCATVTPTFSVLYIYICCSCLCSRDPDFSGPYCAMIACAAVTLTSLAHTVCQTNLCPCSCRMISMLMNQTTVSGKKSMEVTHPRSVVILSVEMLLSFTRWGQLFSRRCFDESCFHGIYIHESYSQSICMECILKA